MEIQQILLDETLRFIDELGVKAVVTIAGVETEVPIYRSVIEGNRLKKFVYLESQTGKISEAILVDSIGRNLHVKDLDITKGPDGFMIVFRVDLRIEGA